VFVVREMWTFLKDGSVTWSFLSVWSFIHCLPIGISFDSRSGLSNYRSRSVSMIPASER